VKKIFLLFVFILGSLSIFAQQGTSPSFGFAANLGTDLLPDPSDPSKFESWSKVGLQPEFSIGKFGIGLDLLLRFKLGTGSNANLEIYEPDWIPQKDQNIFDVYLPKILYIRYGQQWEDPFYIKMGSISDFSLGNGLIVENYSNMRFLPQRRVFGMQLGVDGSLFSFPYIGLELLTGNISKFDVVGGRVYARPLAFMGESLFGKLQLGVTGVFDRDPLLYTGSPYQTLATKPIYVVGSDITLPLVQSPAFSLIPFGEGAYEMNKSIGAIAGIRGRAFSLLSYRAQFRYFQEGFIPSYFDANYDIYRADRFVFIETNLAKNNFIPGWLASLGFDLFKSSLSFGVTLDSPFRELPSTATNNPADYPHVKGSLSLGRGLIPNVSIAARYEKFFLGKKSNNVIKDLIDLEDSYIGMTVSYKAGSAVVSMDYAYIWNPTKNSGKGAFDVVSSLSVGFEL